MVFPKTFSKLNLGEDCVLKLGTDYTLRKLKCRTIDGLKFNFFLELRKKKKIRKISENLISKLS